MDYTEDALRVVLSVPTGRFTYWMLAAGALEYSPVLNESFAAGDQVACWVNSRMQDVELVDSSPTLWELAPGHKVMKDRFVGCKVPDGTPEERRSAKLKADYKARLMRVSGHEKDYNTWFARHCVKPVVIVGTGREHIQNQRQTLLTHAGHWFSGDTHALLNDESTMTSKPERMLHHPFMVFDADVGSIRPWLRAMVPRLVIVTSWSSQMRKHRSLFSRAPQLIITNRRVRSSAMSEIDLREVEGTDLLADVLHDRRPSSIGVTTFVQTAQGEVADGEVDDDDEELL